MPQNLLCASGQRIDNTELHTGQYGSDRHWLSNYPAAADSGASVRKSAYPCRPGDVGGELLPNMFANQPPRMSHRPLATELCLISEWDDAMDTPKVQEISLHAEA